MRYEMDGLIDAARNHNPDALADPDIRDPIARIHTQIV